MRTKIYRCAKGHDTRTELASELREVYCSSVGCTELGRYHRIEASTPAPLSGGPLGTPKTLVEAVENGLRNRNAVPDATAYRLEMISADVEASVRDFLAQRFGVAMMDADREGFATEHALKLLWTRITGKEGL